MHSGALDRSRALDPSGRRTSAFLPRLGLVLLALGLLAAPISAQLTVSSVSPTARGLTVPADSAITIQFDRPVDPASVVARESFWAFGRWSGPADGTFEFLDGNRTVRLVPDQPFSAGENVMVLLSNQLRGEDASTLRAGGYSFQFWVAAQPSSLAFEESQRFSTRTVPQTTSRAYGGLATDMDGDGFLDLTIVNEDTDDLRVFLNGADGSGRFEPMQTPFGIGGVPSPSEPSDFNADGLVDVCTANTVGDSVSIALGAGDGTFTSHQEIPVAGNPRGIAVLDADGDGDVDIVNTNNDNSTLSLLLNDGDGVFGAPIAFGSGSEGEWALAAGDMNEDGLLDLVVGGRDSDRVRVYVNAGDGTFSAGAFQENVGAVWMLVLGDFNGDGHEDVATANSFDNNGSILLGDGLGGLGAPTAHATDPFVLATDVGDLDGDGDLDWVTASFSGDWFLFENNGLGGFSFVQEFDATSAASCSLALDVDNDGDLDLALIDEIADEVIVLAHPGNPTEVFTDGFESGDVSEWSGSQ